MAEHRSSGKRSSGPNDETVEPKAVSQALRRAGQAGGISGTGQAFPHHGFGEVDEQELVDRPLSDEARLSTRDANGTYQTGGAHLNRERQVAIRKDRLAGSTVASKAHIGRDPAPGVPTSRT